MALIKDREGWKKIVKPRPEGIDEWTHWRHGPQANPVAADTVVGPPRHLRWVSEPGWQVHHELDQSIAAVVIGGGRIFYITRLASRLGAINNKYLI